MKLKKGSNNKYGYVNKKTDSWVITPMYSKATEFNKYGIAIVSVSDSRHIIINKDNKNVTGKIYSDIEVMRYGYIMATEVNISEDNELIGKAKCVFLRPDGVEIDALRGAFVIEVSRYKIIKYTKNDKYGVYNLNTGKNIEAQYGRIFDFTDDKGLIDCAVVYDKGKAGMIDWDNNVIIPFNYDELIPYKRFGVVIAKVSDYYGVLDFAGNRVYPFEFTSYSVTNEEIKLNKIVTTVITNNT